MAGVRYWRGLIRRGHKQGGERASHWYPCRGHSETGFAATIENKSNDRSDQTGDHRCNIGCGCEGTRMRAFRTATKQKSGHAHKQCRERQICDRRKNKKKFCHASGGLPYRNALVFQSLQ